MLLRSARRSALRVEPLEDRAVPAALLVDDDKRQFATAAFTSIQAAVNAAAPGDEVVVAPGRYGPFTVPSDKDDLTIRSRNPGQAIIAASAASPATATGALARVAGANDVVLRGFTITGPGSFGVQVDAGGSATIRDNVITGIGNGTFDGKTGLGILVGGREVDGETPADAVVDGNRIVGYERAGIVVVNAGSAATVTRNTVSTGPTSKTAQTGIQVAFEARAIVSGNSVGGNVFTGDIAAGQSAGILVSDTKGVLVSGNRLVGNQNGVIVQAASAVAVLGNTITGSTRDGVNLNSGVSRSAVASNQIVGSGRDGIFVGDTDDSGIAGNTVVGSGRNGLSVDDDSAGNLFLFNTLRSSVGLDALDESVGGLTAGTANTWAGNRIGRASPIGLR